MGHSAVFLLSVPYGSSLALLSYHHLTAVSFIISLCPSFSRLLYGLVFGRLRKRQLILLFLKPTLIFYATRSTCLSSSLMLVMECVDVCTLFFCRLSSSLVISYFLEGEFTQQTWHLQPLVRSFLMIHWQKKFGILSEVARGQSRIRTGIVVTASGVVTVTPKCPYNTGWACPR